MICQECSPDCLSYTPDTCLVWTGPDIKALNIIKGKPYSIAITNIANAVVGLIEQKVNLRCLYDGCGDEDVSIPEGLQKLIDYVCQLNSDNIVSKSKLFCFANDGVSEGSIELTKSKFNVQTNSSSAGGSFTYNIGDVISDLPEGFEKTKVEVTGYGAKKQGSTVLFKTQGESGSLPIPNDRYPVNVDVDVWLKGPEGDVKLSQSVHVPSSSTKISSDYGFDVKDYGVSANTGLKLTTFQDLVSAQVCKNKNDIVNLKTFKVADTNYIKFPSQERTAVISSIVSALDGAIHRIENLGAEKLAGVTCDDKCKQSEANMSLQQILNNYGNQICSSLKRINELEKAVKILEQKVKICCGEGGDDGTTNATSGGNSGTGSGSTTGSCPGGVC